MFEKGSVFKNLGIKLNYILVLIGKLCFFPVDLMNFCVLLQFIASVIKKMENKRITIVNLRKSIVCVSFMVYLLNIKANWIYNNEISEANGVFVADFENTFVSYMCNKEIASQERSYYNYIHSIFDCVFIRMGMFSGDGGVIYFSISSNSFNISYCAFYQCRSSQRGGAIFSQSNMLEIKMTCSNGCYSLDIGNFIFVYYANKLLIEYLSSVDCCRDITTVCSSYLNEGVQIIKNHNCTMNNQIYYSCLFIFSQYFHMSYSTFSNNYANQSIISLRLINPSESRYINIVNNVCQSSMGVISLIKGLLNLRFGVFYENQINLFFTQSNPIWVSNCFISHDSNRIGNVTMTYNNIYTKTPTYQIDFYSTVFCFTDATQPRTYNNQCDFREKNNVYDTRNKIIIIPIVLPLPLIIECV